MAWAIRVGDDLFHLSDLTVAGAAKVCETADCGLLTLDPVEQPGHLATLVAIFSAGPDLTFEAALVAVSSRRLGDVLAEHLVTGGEA